MQHDASDCAAAVVSTVLLRYKKESTIMKIREIIGTDAYGTTIKGIMDGLEKLQFNAKAVRTTVDQLTADLTYPAIAQIKTGEGLSHFVVIHKVTKKDQLIIADPAKGIEYLDKADFAKKFLGVIVFLVPTSAFEVLKLKDKGMFELFVHLVLPQKKLMAVIILASLLLTVLGIFSSFFSKIIMDEIIPYQLKRSLYVFLIVFALVSLVQNLVSAFRQHILLFLSRKIDIPVMMGYYNHIIHLPYSFFGTRKIGDIITRFQDAMTIKDIFTSVSLSLGLDITLALFSSILLWRLNIQLFIILLIMVIINIGLIYFFKKPYRKINYEQMEAGAMLNAQLIESMQNIDTVKAHANETEQLHRLENRFVHALKIGYKEGMLQNSQEFVSTFVNSLGNVFMLGFGALMIIDGEMSIGDLLVFQTLSQFFIDPVQNLVGLQITFQEAQVAMNRLSELMSLEREDAQAEQKIKDVDLKGDLDFKEITFGYGSRPPVLKDFNLTIKQGEKIALVGESGAGKSTIAKLLLQFINPQSGQIMVGKNQLSDLNQQEARKKIAYIPQKIDLFTGTIMDNLKIANPVAKYEEIIAACQLAGADTFIDRLQNRYYSIIEEGGSNLSGGERQRLAIARALLANSDLYIFDEATSHLDSFSEQKIQEIIFKRIQGKTTIIIAHRLSTILNCDRILFVENGQIIESGSHQVLMKKNGRYAQLVRAQSGLNLKVDQTVNDESDEKNEEEVSYE